MGVRSNSAASSRAANALSGIRAAVGVGMFVGLAVGGNVRDSDGTAATIGALVGVTVRSLSPPAFNKPPSMMTTPAATATIVASAMPVPILSGRAVCVRAPAGCSASADPRPYPPSRQRTALDLARQ